MAVIEIQSLEWSDPLAILHFMRGKASNRKFQLFSCGCCRKVWDLLPAPWSREVVEVSERYADGSAAEAEVRAITDRARTYFKANYTHRNSPAYEAAACCGWIGVPPVAARKVYEKLHGGVCPIAKPLANTTFTHLLRDIFGSPFGLIPKEPDWLTPTVLALAQTAYDARVLPAGHLDPQRLLILADALEDAGCTAPAILGHLRSPGPHVRGCHVLDLLLGKE